MPAGYSYRGGLIKKDFGEIFLAAKVEDENMFQIFSLRQQLGPQDFTKWPCYDVFISKP